MIKNSQNIDLFDRYLAKELTQHELEVFDEQLKNDSLFREEFMAYQSSIDIIDTFGLGLEMREIIERNQDASYMRWIFVAASILIVGFSLAVVANLFSSADYEELFEVYYEPFPSAGITRGEYEQERAYQFYDQGSYTEALPLLKNLSDEKHDSRIQLLIGICQLEMGDIEVARLSFETVVQSDHVILSQHAEWYLGMTYLI